MDKNNSGEIGYDEFTLLSDERWRNMDPYLRYQEGLGAHQSNVNSSLTRQDSLKMPKNEASKLGIKANDAIGYQKLEDLAREHLKIPFKQPDKETGFMNINRSDPAGYMSVSSEFPIHGRASEPHQKIHNVLRHDYLRKSMVDRIERKSLLNNFRKTSK